MLEKFLNKNVVIEEKLFRYPSTLRGGKLASDMTQNKIEGVVTAIDDEFVEIDNNMLISRKFIYRITLK